MRRGALFLAWIGALTLLLACAFRSGAQAAGSPQEPEPPQPYEGLDPFAIPELPEHPTQMDLGANVYFYHCMPCHGDVGQGLTREFRELWVDDHQNCWDDGCHGGRTGDEGFPISRHVPAVIAPDDALQHFQTYEVLIEYLRQTHPPQRPGALAEAEYADVSAFLLAKNGRPVEAHQSTPLALEAFLAASLLLSLALIRQTRPERE